MNDDNRIVELLTDMLFEQRNMLAEQKKSNERLDKLEKQQAKTNLAIGELRLSFIKLADKIEIITQLDKRVLRLEDVVFHA
jgi:hypothetical protein